MDELGTVLREELARSRPGWPRGAGVIAAASRNGVTAHHAVGTIDDAGTGPDPGTLYRIASISKVFTALALAIAVRRGEVELDQPAGGYLPDGFRLPRDGGRPILVEHLATHTSGLPRGVPGAGTADDLAGRLARTALETPPGQVYRYSNVGVQLLGLLLARAAGTTYPSLLAERICRPLGLADTTLDPDPHQLRRLAGGRDDQGNPTDTPVIGVGAPSGGLYSTTADLLRFLRPHLDGRGELGADAAFAMAPRFAAPDGVTLGLCWHRSTLRTGATSVWHNGGLPGYHSFAAVLPSAEASLVMLANHDTDLETTATAILGRLSP